MEKSELEQIIKEYILEELIPRENKGAIKIDNQTQLMTDRILDSITILRLVVFLEERFNIQVDTHEASVEYLDTLEMMSDFVQSKLQA